MYMQNALHRQYAPESINPEVVSFHWTCLYNTDSSIYSYIKIAL